MIDEPYGNRYVARHFLIHARFQGRRCRNLRANIEEGEPEDDDPEPDLLECEHRVCKDCLPLPMYQAIMFDADIETW